MRGLGAASGSRAHYLIGYLMSQGGKSSLNCEKCCVPAVGINAAINSRDFGTFRWQLNEQKLHPSAALWKGPRTSEIGRYCCKSRFAKGVEFRGLQPRFSCRDPRDLIASR
jgi:hypothetical protein